MKVNEYLVLTDSVERGVAHGWRRAHKHNDNPSKDAIQSAIIDAVMLDISQYFSFEDHAVTDYDTTCGDTLFRGHNV